MTSNVPQFCPIWGEGFPTTVRRRPSQGITEVPDSPRAGGAYHLLGDADREVGKLTDRQKSVLTTWLLAQHQQGADWPEVTMGILGYIKTRQSLPVPERADRLLRFIAGQGELAGKPYTIGDRNLIRDCNPALYAWSESIDKEEVGYLVEYLLKKSWLDPIMPDHLVVLGSYIIPYSVRVTVDGHSHIADRLVNTDLTQAFVAMWFDPSMDEAYWQGIEPAIREAGYKALRIDQKPHNNKIDDEIIAEIRRSKFLVADFTQGDDGARGGVYYEAGFAHGLGLKVIFTCRKDAIDKVHFDTNHYNHVVWATPAELLKGVKDRILAEFGQGPLPPNQ